MILASAEPARKWLLAGLDLCRVGSRGTDALSDAAPLLSVAGSELPLLPPPGFLLDMARLFLNPRQELSRTPIPLLSDVLRRYEDAVLGRLATAPLRLGISDALLSLPPSKRPMGIAVLAERVLDRVQFSAGQRVHPGALRALSRTPHEDGEAPSTARLRPVVLKLLHTAYSDLILHFQQCGQPLRMSDVTVLEQLDVLTRRSDRLALSQVVNAAEQLQRGLPNRPRPSHRRDGHVSTQLRDDSAYPVGGFSSISTQGSIENLVSSELALMEDGPEVDLFDLRLMEGELLFYTRDETVFVRGRRVITLRLHSELENARFRDPSLPFQRLVMTLGWIVALTTILVRWLEREDLLVRICPPPNLLLEETHILSLILAEGLHAGWLRIEPLEEASITDLLIKDARSSPVDQIVLQLGDHPITTPEHTWTTVLRCGEHPLLQTPFRGEISLPEAPLAAWRQTLFHALTDLI